MACSSWEKKGWKDTYTHTHAHTQREREVGRGRKREIMKKVICVTCCTAMICTTCSLCFGYFCTLRDIYRSPIIRSFRAIVCPWFFNMLVILCERIKNRYVMLFLIICNILRDNLSAFKRNANNKKRYINQWMSCWLFEIFFYDYYQFL